MFDYVDSDEEQLDAPGACALARRTGTDVFHGVVRKLLINHGAGLEVGDRDAEVSCTMKMFSVEWPQPKGAGAREQGKDSPDGSLPQLQLLYCHGRDNLFVRRIDCIVPIGLKLAIATMAAGERAWIWVDSVMAFGPQGLVFDGGSADGQVPAGRDLLFELRLLSIRQPELTKIGFSSAVSTGRKLTFDRMPEVREEMDRADELLAAGNRQAAQRLWCRIIRKLSSMRIDAIANPAHSRARDAVLVEVQKKAGENALEIGWYTLAVTYNRYVIQSEPDNAYSHYLLGRAYFALGCVSSARYFCRRASLMDMSKPLYAQKLAEIQTHCRLLDDDSEDSGDELEDDEMLADILDQNLREKHKRIIKQVERKIMEHIEKDAKRIEIEGGFDEEILDDIHRRLVEMNRGANSVIAKRSPNGIEILL